MPERERTQQYGVDDAEDGGVGADSHANRERGEEEEPRRTPERAAGVPQILNQPFDHWALNASTGGIRDARLAGK